MGIAENQQRLIGRLSLIEDRHERLAAVVDRVRKAPPLPPTERVEANRIQGCISRVWLAASVQEGCCRFRVDADSPLVRGLAALLCEVYDGAPPGEVAGFASDILDQLGLEAQLTATRRTGLEHLQRTIREFGARIAPSAG